MATSITSINPPPSSSVSPIIGNASAPFVAGAQASLNKLPSATVTLSSQGQQLSQTQTSPSQSSQAQTGQSISTGRNDTVTTENVEPKSKEAAEPPGIQFMEGERKGGRINTYA